MKIGSYGVVLILLGILSYIIPIFGIQFRIVELFNLITGGFGGILIIFIGIVLIVISVLLRKKS